jgi:radical SAM superfamily enzyme YgiQ (UPF0313 family)
MGMRVEAGIIIGSPGETREDMEATYRFLTNAPIDSFGVQILSPLPGTRLWKQAEAKGLVSDTMNFDKLWNWNQDHVLSNPNSFIYCNDIVHRVEFLRIFKRFVDYMRRKGGYGDPIEALLCLDFRVWANAIRHPALILAAAKKSFIALVGKSPTLFRALRRAKKVVYNIYTKQIKQYGSDRY